MLVSPKTRRPWAVCFALASLLGSLAACEAPESRGPWSLSGAAARYGRLSHAGIRVSVEPDGPATLTDARGGWRLTGAPDGTRDGVELRFETPGFAPEVRRAWSPGEQTGLVLYRGRRLEIAPDMVVVDAEEVPPAGLLLTGETGERLLVDLEAGAVSLSLGPDWRPSGEAVDGFVVGIDAVTGEVTGASPDGSRASPAGFTHRGAISAGGERQGMVLSRPLTVASDAETPETANQPQEVVYWVPGAEPIAFPEPVLAVGPPLRLRSGNETITLLVADGWLHWLPGAAPVRLATLDPEWAPTVTPLFAPQGAGPSLCYAWGAPGARAVDCVGLDRPARTIAHLSAVDTPDTPDTPATPATPATPDTPATPNTPDTPTPDTPTPDTPGTPAARETPDPLRPALVSADPPLVIWREPARAECRAALADGGTMPVAFPCQPARVTAYPLGDSVVFQDARGELHRLAPNLYTPLGPGRALKGGGEVLGYLADGRWLTLLKPDGAQIVAAEPCSPNTALHVAGAGLLAIDTDAKRALHLAGDGRFGVVPLLSADLRAAENPAQISRTDDVIGLAGAHGFLRLDLSRSKVFSLVHRGWRFLDFSWRAGTELETTLPEIALIRAGGRVRAIDLYTLASEPLGDGAPAGLLSGRAWFVNERGLYIVDDPAAE